MRFSLLGARPILLGHTLDLDSTVFCRYGEQQGSLKGYNPKKPGRPSHHPLVGFLAEARRLLWATLRSGNTGSDRFHFTYPRNINEGTHLMSQKEPTEFQVVPLVF